jgi:hypothetical protein
VSYVQDETVALHGGIALVPLRGLAALLFFGGFVYALVSGNWGTGAIAFGLGAVVLGMERLREGLRHHGRVERDGSLKIHSNELNDA